MRGLQIMLSITIIIASFSFPYGSKAADFDGFHDAIREWWNVDAFIKGDGNYSITASFEYEKET
ncbi:MAG TPA: hypothetical protein ENJ70_00080, partial [Thermoplasmatales archaeon]|nr:hypothetical protein [Thermoplasmatales archaeon]